MSKLSDIKAAQAKVKVTRKLLDRLLEDKSTRKSMIEDWEDRLRIAEKELSDLRVAGARSERN